MEEKRVIVIKPTNVLYQLSNDKDNPLSKKRVCAYARVSTDSTDQLHSYNAQISEYTKRIKENKDWEFIGLYADEGLSGTSIKKRPQFLKMIEDAKAGKFDLILTKSLSRFARNTVDTLTTIRKLRDINVEVFFEKENIYSSDSKVDFMLTIFSSIAQEESRNISENIKWGFRKRFKEGIVHINTSRFLGYDKDEFGKIVINPKQAKIVTMIFNMYIAGSSLKEIADFLTDNQIPNGRGVVFWKPATVSSILTNEKYCGDAILQKRVTVDYLTHKSVKNVGQAPKYYIMNNHDPIIPRKKFEFVQELKKKRSENHKYSKYSNKYPLSGIVYCGVCKRVMNRVYYNYRKPSERIVLSCKNKYKDKHVCSNKPIDNSTLELAILDSFKKLNLSNTPLIDKTLNIVSSNLSWDNLENDIKALELDIASIESDILELVKMNVSDLKTNSDFYKDIYNQKKAILVDKKLLLNNKKRLLLNNKLNEDRIKQMREFLNGNIALNRFVLLGIYKAIIAISKHEALFIMSNNSLSKSFITSNIDAFKLMKPIYSSTFINPNNQISISYKIIKLEDD